MSAGRLLYLSAQDVADVGVSMSEIIEALEAMFVEKGKGEVEMPPKPGIHTRPNAFIHAMPAYIPSLGSAGLKWVSGYPDNPTKGLPYISGLLILNDPESGIPISVMDASWITAMRTGAATAVAAKRLARSDSRSVGIVACGVQGRTNLEALNCAFSLERVHAYDIDSAAAKRYAEEMSERFGLDVAVVGHPREAVRDLDLVVTSGPILKQPSPTIEAGWLSAGAFGLRLLLAGRCAGRSGQAGHGRYRPDGLLPPGRLLSIHAATVRGPGRDRLRREAGPRVSRRTSYLRQSGPRLGRHGHGAACLRESGPKANRNRTAAVTADWRYAVQE